MSVTPSDLARTLVERAARVRRAHAQRAEAIIAAIRILLAEEPIRGAWIVGSLTRPYFGEGSDADIVVAGLVASERDRLWSKLSAALSVPVDLLLLEELSPEHRVRVETEGLHVS